MLLVVELARHLIRVTDSLSAAVVPCGSSVVAALVKLERSSAVPSIVDLGKSRRLVVQLVVELARHLRRVTDSLHK